MNEREREREREREKVKEALNEEEIIIRRRVLLRALSGFRLSQKHGNEGWVEMNIFHDKHAGVLFGALPSTQIAMAQCLCFLFECPTLAY